MSFDLTPFQFLFFFFFSFFFFFFFFFFLGNFFFFQDTSSYAIQKKIHEEWPKIVPEGFIFHFKAYGLLTLLSVPVASLPYQVRDVLPDILKLKESVSQSDLGDELVDRVFAVQNEALAKFHDAGKLGVIVFQFQANVKLADDSWAYVMRCRKQLDSRFVMGVEFRSTSWFQPQANLESTLKRCRDNNLLLIGVDELIESEHSKYKQSLTVINDKFDEYPVGEGLPPKKLLICTQTLPDQIYLRVHRRMGEERRLSAVELRQWADAILAVAARCTTPTTIWMLWNSNYEDHSMINAAELVKLLNSSPLLQITDWKAIMRERETSNKKSLLSFFSAKRPASAVASAAAAATADTASSGTTAAAAAAAAVDHDLDDDDYHVALAVAAAEAAAASGADEPPSSGSAKSTPSKAKVSATSSPVVKRARKESGPNTPSSGSAATTSDAKQPSLKAFFKK
jgi:uncharacterized protein YecE (DUF72 family)